MGRKSLFLGICLAVLCQAAGAADAKAGAKSGAIAAPNFVGTTWTITVIQPHVQQQGSTVTFQPNGVGIAYFAQDTAHQNPFVVTWSQDNTQGKLHWKMYNVVETGGNWYPTDFSNTWLNYQAGQPIRMGSGYADNKAPGGSYSYNFNQTQKTASKK